MKQLLIATHNPGKLIEYRELFADISVRLIMLNDLGINHDPEETGQTFKENAILKAKYYSQFTNLPILTEDSGLEIDYLNGEPGVHSKRWLGRPATDQELADFALNKLKGVPPEKRGAQFRVVQALKIADKKIITSEGVLRGSITEKIESPIIPGFPFRSIFYVPELSKVLGALTMAEEAKVAHRRFALDKLILQLKKSQWGL